MTVEQPLPEVLVDAPPPRRVVSDADVVDFLNHCLKLDCHWTYALVSYRCGCNSLIADHPSIQARRDYTNCTSAGALGFLNGLFGHRLGTIQAVFDKEEDGTDVLSHFALAPNAIPRHGAHGRMIVFLGGTCNGSQWREELLGRLPVFVEAFNPVVPNWDDAARERELEMRGKAGLVVYTITPRMTGTYAIAELTEDSIRLGSRCLVCLLREDTDNDGSKIRFDEKPWGSLQAVANLADRNGAKVFWNLEDLALHINSIEDVEKSAG